MRTLILISFFLALISCKQETIDSVIVDLKPTGLNYEINSKNDTILTLPSGIKIGIYSNSFDNDNDSLVTLEINDLGKMSDIIKYGISTVSDNKLLQTRGMVKITAFTGDKELNLRSGKSITVSFLKEFTDNHYMNLFLGEENENNKINWKFDSAYYNSNIAYITDWEVYPEFFGRRFVRLTGIDDKLVDSLIPSFYKNFDITKMEVSPERIEERYHAYYKFSNSKTDYKFELKRWLYSTDETVYFDTVPVDKYLYSYLENFPAAAPFIESNDLRYHNVRILFSIGQMPKNYYDSFSKSLSYATWQCNGWLKDMESEVDSAFEQDSIDYFILNSTKLGWINCDYFIDFKGEMTTIELPTDKKYSYKAALIFKNYQSVLWADSYNYKISFYNVPIDEPVSFLMIRKNETLEFFRKETVIDSIPKTVIDFKNITLDELEYEINLIE